MTEYFLAGFLAQPVDGWHTWGYGGPWGAPWFFIGPLWATPLPVVTNSSVMLTSTRLRDKITSRMIAPSIQVCRGVSQTRPYTHVVRLP